MRTRRHSLLPDAALCVAVLLPSLLSAQPRGDRQSSVPAPDWKAFDAYVERTMKEWEVPGLAIAVVKDDRVVFMKGYGVRRLGSPEPVDEHTLFAIGSTTKAMTAVAAAMLADEGKLRLDEPVRTYLPWMQLHDPVMSKEITVRDLLTHHTGIGNTDLLWLNPARSTREVIERMRFAAPEASFRSRYAYQNVQYAMAGEVIAAASGQPWAEVVRQRIFAPLGMDGTRALLSQAAGESNVAQPHMKIAGTTQVIANRPVDPVAAAGAVWSSVADMSRWMRFVLDSGRVDGRRLLSAPAYADWLGPQVVVPKASFYPTTSLTRPHTIAYGLGWFLHDYRGEAVAMHTGSIDGMCAIIGLIPDRRFGVYVLENVDHAELRHALMLRAMDMDIGGPARDWSGDLRRLYGGLAAAGDSARRAADGARVAGTKPSLALPRYAGQYRDDLYGTVAISASGAGLRINVDGALSGRLEHWHHDTFRVTWDDVRQGPSQLTFTLDGSGTAKWLVVDLAQGTRFVRVD